MVSDCCASMRFGYLFCANGKLWCAFCWFENAIFDANTIYYDQTTDKIIFPWQIRNAQHTQFNLSLFVQVYHFPFYISLLAIALFKNHHKIPLNNNITENDYLHIILKLYNILRPIYFAYN